MLNIFVWLLLIFSQNGVVQEPVQWAFTAEKISHNIYEIHLRAAISPGWHIFSMVQPPDAIPEPTTVRFSSNAELIFKGGLNEFGKLIHVEDSVNGLSANQYEHAVDFVQIVQAKPIHPGPIKGYIQFQICSEAKCFPLKKVDFLIDLK